MGETRIDLLRLLEDLRDAYPNSVEETIVTEMVANALDSGASEIAFRTDPTASTFMGMDDGRGMSRQALSRYHDLAVTSKRRGTSIGFAGVGIKLGLLVSDEVVTETLTARRKTSLATSWRLATRTRAPWRWIEPPGVLGGRGTAVRLYLSNSLSRLLDPGFVETAIYRNFEPLFDAEILGTILADAYPAGVRFRLNQRVLAKTRRGPDGVPLQLRIGRQRKPSAVGYLTRDPQVQTDGEGIAVSTLGKVINRGWDWLGLSAPPVDPVQGLVEVPALAETLTLNKADFIRAGARGSTFLAYRKALQEVVTMQLEAWGQVPGKGKKPKRRTRSMERDLSSVLASLSDDYPMLAALVERRPGGQHRLPLAEGPGERGRSPGTGSAVGAMNAADDVTGDSIPQPQPLNPDGAGSAGEWASQEADVDRKNPAEAAEAKTDISSTQAGGLSGRASRRKPSHYGLQIRFENREDAPTLGRLIENTVWVNEGHPAYRRAIASRSEGYHVALSVAMALAAIAVEPRQAHAFVSDFLASWGQAGLR